jgi:hypothetical protein
MLPEVIALLFQTLLQICLHCSAVHVICCCCFCQVMEVRQLRARLAAAEHQLMGVRGSPIPGQAAAAGADMQRFQVRAVHAVSLSSLKWTE